IAAAGADRTRRYAMDQSPAACLASAHATDDIPGGATQVGGVRDLSLGFLLRTGAGRGGENLLPTCVLCHVNRSTLIRNHQHVPEKSVITSLMERTSPQLNAAFERA